MSSSRRSPRHRRRAGDGATATSERLVRTGSGTAPGHQAEPEPGARVERQPLMAGRLRHRNRFSYSRMRRPVGHLSWRRQVTVAWRSGSRPAQIVSSVKTDSRLIDSLPRIPLPQFVQHRDESGPPLHPGLSSTVPQGGTGYLAGQTGSQARKPVVRRNELLQNCPISGYDATSLSDTLASLRMTGQ